ncbi:MAG: hypothetical protein D6772_17280 [Bacteroidetes bacterium]|nr:MAG: hypothetical protein D6772_17280 [Bacteroidota bacterium]
MRYILLFCCSLLCAGQLVAQSSNKFEREYRTSPEEIPPTALDFVAASGPFDKVRWYKEISQDGTTIEAKAKRKGVRYSIEFDASGHILDVEVLTPFPKLPTGVQDSICAQLTRTYDRFRLTRIQRQWTAPRPLSLQLLLRDGNTSQAYTEHYELVIRAHTPTGTEWYEYLFDAKGQMLRQQRIIFRNTDNLDY